MRARKRLGCSRREVMVAGAAALAAGLVAPAATSANSLVLNGMAGGGVARWDGGEAQVSVFVSQVQFTDAQQELFLGRIQWVDATNGLTLETTNLTAYETMTDNAGGRIVRGLMQVNGAGSVPFLLQVIDGGPPGSGKDTFDLKVGAAVSGVAEWQGGVTGNEPNFGYAAAGHLASGDFEWLSANAKLYPAKT